MSYRAGSTADLRHRWRKVAGHLDAAVAELAGPGGLATWLNDETADYRAMVAVHVMHSAALAAELAGVEAGTIAGDDAAEGPSS
jgi:vacuolar-type H+-ATPase catalytic subunit A/Vma1